MLISLIFAAALAGSRDPDGVITTAPKGEQSVPVDAQPPVAPVVSTETTQTLTPHGLTTQEQIDRWVNARSADERPFSDARWGPRDDRKLHGSVGAAIGTGDFSAYSAEVSLPVGESGRLDLRYEQSRNGYGPYGYSAYGYGAGYPGYGYGAGYGERSRSESVGLSFSSDSRTSRSAWD